MLFSLPILLSSCLGTKQLKENEYLLYSQEINGNESFDTEDLDDLLLQQPNGRVPLLPISIPVWSYQVGLNSFDTAKVEQKIEDVKAKYDAKIEEAGDNTRKEVKLERKRDNKLQRLERKLEEGNFLMRRGEPPAIYDSLLTEDSKEQLRLHYFSEGFFNATVEYDTTTKGKRLYLTFNINETEPYTLDSIFYTIPDSAVRTLVFENNDNRILKVGQRYQQELFNNERDRLEDLLRNNGYFDFSKQYIEYNIDSTWTQNGIATEIKISNPQGRKNHKYFEVDSVVFITDADVGLTGERETYTLNDITYQYYKRKYNERILDNRVLIRPDEPYSRLKTFNTQRQLFNLDLFKFANIVYDTTGNNMLATIYTSPLPKWQISTETGVNVTQGLPGPMVNFTVRDRNVLKTLGILEFSGRFAVEGVAGAATQESVYKSLEYGANLSLTLPGFAIPFGRRLTRYFGNTNPRTRLSTGFNYINRPEYNRNNINASFGYQWLTSKNHSFTVNLLDVSIIESQIKSGDFSDRLDELAAAGNNLIFSFRTSFSSNMNAQAIFNFNNYGNKETKSSMIRAYFESTGTFLNLYRNVIENDLGLFPFQFLKGQVEYRNHIPINRGTQFAWRVNSGLALTYGGSEVLPYEKYFFAGGSNSIRAWAPRRLGPGSFVFRGEDGKPDYRFEQPGEMLLEASAEIRQHLFSFVQGALFVDAGNVWYIKTEPVEGGRFNADDFLSEIAIGTGLGLRLDFDFLVLRFDAGIKTYDPAQNPGERWVIRNLSWKRPFGVKNQTVWNIAIGYPF